VNWQDTRAEHREGGKTWHVGRAALVMEFYGTGAELNSSGEAILDVCLGAAPSDLRDELHVFSSRDYKKLTPQMERRMRKELRELSQRGRFYAATTNNNCAVGEYSFEINLGNTEPLSNNLVYIALPLSAGEPERANEAVALFERMLAAGPFWGAIAGFGFDIVWGREFEMSAMPVNFGLARRYHGMLVRDRLQSLALPQYVAGSAPRLRIPSVAWLTYLGPTLLDQLGGQDTLLPQLAPASHKALGQGILIRTGQTPPVGDVNRQDADLQPLRDLDRVLKPIILEQWFLSASLLGVDRDTASAWLHRFEP
jgi:Protein of unknown function (DUF3396)